MSYAPNAERIRATTRAAGGHGPDRERTLGRSARDAQAARRPRGKPYEVEHDWALYGKLGLAIATGVGVGAGLALLVTSETGPQRRASIAKGARRLGHRAERAWNDLAFELGEAARTLRDRRRLRRVRAAEAETDADD